MFARAVLMIVSKIIAHAAFMLIAVVLARSLSKVEFGTFNQVWLFNKALMFLFDLGLPMSVYYFWPRLADRQKKGFILQTLVSLTVLAIPFSAIMYVGADFLAQHFQNPALADHLQLFAIYPLVMLPASATEEILLSQGYTGRAALFESCTKMMMIGAVAIAALWTHQLNWVLKALIGYGIIQALLGIWLVWQPVRPLQTTFSFKDWQQQLRYSAPYGFSTLAAVLNYQVDKILVSLFNPPAAFAMYVAGAFEIPLAGVTALPVISVMMNDFTQKYANQDIEGVLSLWQNSMRKVALPVFAVTAFLMVFAEPTVTGLFSAKYRESVWPFRIFLLFLPLRITVWDYVLASLGKTKAVFTSQLIALGINIFLGGSLIFFYGWWGAAIAAVISGYTQTALIMLAIQRQLGVSLAKLLPWKDLCKIGGVAIAAGMGSLPISLLSIGSFFQIGVGFLLFMLLYGMGNFMLGTITIAELKKVVQLGLAKVKVAKNN
jgi:O-antigen/teichoic acid export membrane protein